MFVSAAPTSAACARPGGEGGGSGSVGVRETVQLIHRWSEPRSLGMEGCSEPRLDAKSEVTNQLVDFQWKLGMAVSSDSCRSLKYPYVAVLLKVADHSGQVKNKCFEMTIPQFQNFYRQFKEIAAVIETV
uniref:COMM domain-containing protein 6 isoform X1 n=1 Tax=Nyctereutes procyonoides TaxID=34880 RepID=UPI002444B26B|nr:COMM domain-containing protein 6 isoform X1 [Nyctereutes procyonoides]